MRLHVEAYLDEHPDFLESYVLRKVKPTTVERWQELKPGNDNIVVNIDDDIIDKSEKWTNEQLLEDMILIEDERQGLNYLAAIIGYKCKKIDDTLLSDKPINSSKEFKESYWFIGEYT